MAKYGKKAQQEVRRGTLKCAAQGGVVHQSLKKISPF
jgi:hypothetical protein